MTVLTLKEVLNFVTTMFALPASVKVMLKLENGLWLKQQDWP